MTEPATTFPTYSPPEQTLRPVMAHDGLTFDELARTYNFRKTSDRRLVFARLLVDELMHRGKPTRVLDIGCGSGFSKGPEFTWAVRQHATEMWGIEPDPHVPIDPRMFDNVQRCLLEQATLPTNHFDLVYAFLVMEHVADPRAFMKAVQACLKPGGVFMFLTPNGRHYFTRIASTLHLLHLDELALRMIRPSKDVEWYHYPVTYSFNSPRQVSKVTKPLGFEEPRYLFLEDYGPRSYFPGPLKPIFWLLSLKRKLLLNPKCLLDLVGCIRKPAR
jgi:2-polyprenyl-3-methyl-5-hydroxy-6-metoxy-1,4-benzoquinol methylase